MYEYNVDYINAGITARKKIARVCRQLATKYAPVELPASVIKRIFTRRKLYNFLEALDLTHANIQAIFWAHNLAVPRNRELRPAAVPASEIRPAWLENLD